MTVPTKVTGLVNLGSSVHKSQTEGVLQIRERHSSNCELTVETAEHFCIWKLVVVINYMTLGNFCCGSLIFSFSTETCFIKVGDAYSRTALIICVTGSDGDLVSVYDFSNEGLLYLPNHMFFYSLLGIYDELVLV